MNLPIILENMTVETVRETLKTVKTAVLPIGCTEQHGYHMPLCTDTVIPERGALEAGKRVPCFVLPTISYSYSGGFLEGTTQIQPNTVYLVVRDLIDSLYAQGFRGLVIESGHGGGHHIAAITKAVEEAADKYPLMIIGFLGMKGFIFDTLIKECAGHTHATTYEMSLMMYLTPDLVHPENAPWEDRPNMHDPISELDLKIINKKLKNERDFDKKVKIGVGGDPMKGSSLELGKAIFDEMVNNLVKLIKRVNETVEEKTK